VPFLVTGTFVLVFTVFCAIDVERGDEVFHMPVGIVVMILSIAITTVITTTRNSLLRQPSDLVLTVLVCRRWPPWPLACP
jgi:hypothetical protein